jgi:hypothetical protein
MDIADLILGAILGFILVQTWSAFLRYRKEHAFRPLNVPSAPGWLSRHIRDGEHSANWGPSLDVFAPVAGPERVHQTCWVCGRLKNAPDGYDPKQLDGVCRH